MASARQLALHRDLRQRIRDSQLRVTGPRVAVLERLVAAKGPVSHGELADKLAPAGWDRATVFRVLNDLTEASLVHRVDLGDHVWRFEYCAESEPHAGGEHPHFVCNDCGDVVCLPDADVQVKSSTGPRALRGHALEIQLKGRCDRCA